VFPDRDIFGVTKRASKAANTTEARHILTKVKGAAWYLAGKWVGRKSYGMVL